MPVSWPSPPLHRSYLYAPGSSIRVMRKALMAGADAVILDLEDAVAPESKAGARAAVAGLLDEIARDAAATSSQVHVRINRDGDGYLEEDLDAVVRPGLDAIRLPKAESPEALCTVDTVLARLETERSLDPGRIHVYPTVESALGAASITELATTPRVARFAIGAADLLADLGVAHEEEFSTLHIRSELVLRSRLAAVGPPIDSVHTDLDDAVGLRRQAMYARSLGFHGKSVIHPSQLGVVNEVFTPSDEEIARAERLVSAAEGAFREGHGAIALDGEFVDAAVLRRARALLALRSR